MRQQVINYLRFAGFSVTALALMAFLKLTGQPAWAGPPEPRLGQAPKASENEPAAQTDDQRLDELEGEIARLSDEIVHLRAALDLMGPLPDHPGLSLPIEPARLAEAVPQASADPLDIRKSDLFAPPPSLEGARSLFYAAELGAFKTRDAAEANWRRIAKDARLAAFSPRFTTDGAQTRLVVGSLPNAQAVDALCVELSGLTGACRPFVPVRTY
ncbi:MAG TPA: SPOR domain-containing protein [Hyphomonadaceae bacterium]|jgi:hypothetical protein|nr:SPOR domain-containing protein [Hyphomonadaceae bacterium]